VAKEIVSEADLIKMHRKTVRGIKSAFGRIDKIY